MKSLCACALLNLPKLMTSSQVITCARNAEDLQDLEKQAESKGWHVKVALTVLPKLSCVEIAP